MRSIIETRNVNCKPKFWSILWLEYILACLNCCYFIDTSSASFTNCNNETLSAWWGWCFEVRCFKKICGLSSLLQQCQTSRIANDGSQALKSRCRCMASQILNVSKEMS